MGESCSEGLALGDQDLKNRAKTFTKAFNEAWLNASPSRILSVNLSQANITTREIATQFIKDTVKLNEDAQHQVFTRVQKLNDYAKCLDDPTFLPILNIVFDSKDQLAEFQELTRTHSSNLGVSLPIDLYHR